jgi:hypothetical protein
LRHHQLLHSLTWAGGGGGRAPAGLMEPKGLVVVGGVDDGNGNPPACGAVLVC